jgi:hypothetical protein
MPLLFYKIFFLRVNKINSLLKFKSDRSQKQRVVISGIVKRAYYFIFGKDECVYFTFPSIIKNRSTKDEYFDRVGVVSVNIPVFSLRLHIHKLFLTNI